MCGNSIFALDTPQEKKKPTRPRSSKQNDEFAVKNVFESKKIFQHITRHKGGSNSSSTKCTYSKFSNAENDPMAYPPTVINAMNAMSMYPMYLCTTRQTDSAINTSRLIILHKNSLKITPKFFTSLFHPPTQEERHGHNKISIEKKKGERIEWEWDT
jgi:hypothetical protein